MSGDKHTPGPWVRDRSSGARCDVRAESGRKVALCWGLSTSRAAQANSVQYRAECDANARLIAAAPDLLEALERLFESYKSLADSGDVGFWALEDLEEGQSAIAAIRKAKGAFDPAPPKYPDKASPEPVDHVSGQRIRDRERYD